MNGSNICKLPTSNNARESSERMMKSLFSGSFHEQILTNKAKPFSDKEVNYLLSHERITRSRNHRYLLECRGEEE